MSSQLHDQTVVQGHFYLSQITLMQVFCWQSDKIELYGHYDRALLERL